MENDLKQFSAIFYQKIIELLLFSICYIKELNELIKMYLK